MNKFIVLLAMLLVMPIVGCGSSSASLPSAPTNVTASSVVGKTGEITISWSPVQDATSYNIYWSTILSVPQYVAPRNGAPISPTSNPDTINVTTNTYTHTGLNSATLYHYQVTAVNGNGESPLSTQVDAVPL